MISNAYNYYMSMYGYKGFGRYDSHKSSDLKSTYNKMVSINRNSPLYKVDLFSEVNQKLAIDIKEAAREISNVVNELDDAASGKYAISYDTESDNDSVATASYLGGDSPSTESLDINVIKKASPQVNTGNFMPPQSHYLSAGTYSFDLNIDNITYEFQYNVNFGETTNDVQNKISRLINNSNVGVTAAVLTNYSGDTALAITSNETGNHGDDPIFHISDVNTTHNGNVVDLLGINHISDMPEDALYSINDTTYSSPKNKFVYNNEFELSLNGTGRCNISLIQNSDTLSGHVTSLIDSYNKAVELSSNSANNLNNSRMYLEFTRLANSYADVLNKNGLDISDNGTISIDPDKFSKLSDSAGIKDMVEELESFKKGLMSKADSMFSNPVEYLSKKVVAYKNPKNNFPNPYSDSVYAGMIFDGFY